MLTMASFFALMVKMSARSNIARAVAASVSLRPSGSSRQMRKAFSAKRQASSTSGTPRARQSADTASRFFIETAWPPMVLLVTVITTKAMFPACAAKAVSKAFEIHVAAEVPVARERVGVGQVDACAAGCFDVGARGVEEPVGEHHLARERHHRAEDPLGRAALVRGEDVLHPGERVRDLLQPEVALGARVRLVAAHHRGPLLRAHRPGAGVGEQVDDDVVGLHGEEVVVRLLEDEAALRGRGHADGLDDLDAERLDDGAGHGGLWGRGRSLPPLLRPGGRFVEPARAPRRPRTRAASGLPGRSGPPAGRAAGSPQRSHRRARGEAPPRRAGAPNDPLPRR